MKSLTPFAQGYVKGWLIGKAVGLTILAVILLIGWALSGCATKPVPPPVLAPGAPTCETACAHLEHLGCPAAKPTPRGATCRDVCANIEDSGIVDYGEACVTTAPTCAAADACGGPTK